MTAPTRIRPNALGDLRAESDRRMLDAAFLETPDYRTLIETSERIVVVGRRGTGKSAIAYRLEQHWNRSAGAVVVPIAPEEDQVIGIRPIMALFGDRFTHIRAGARIAWRYALLMEIAERVPAFRLAKASGTTLQASLKDWRASGHGVSERLRVTLQERLKGFATPEQRISGLARALKVDEIQSALETVVDSGNQLFVLLIDRLDEGYEPDTPGVAFVDGVVHAALDLLSRLSFVRPTLFLRDNIFRAVSRLDPDYSRNIEGQVLRLHWDDYQLFNLVCNRLRVAFHLDIEQNLKVWNRSTAQSLQGREGFKKCLQLTLYRPRDILALLNEALYLAARQDRAQLIDEDLEHTAKLISSNRLDDLHKEYSVILPGLSTFTSAFSGGSPEMSVADVHQTVATVLDGSTASEASALQDIFIHEKPEDVFSTLYSVGFLGIRDASSGSFVFCHDGKGASRDVLGTDRVLVHPCYWMSLSLTRNTLKQEEAEEIDDDYAIEVSSVTPEIRRTKLGQLIAELDSIPMGQEGAASFEEWCYRAVRIAFAPDLSNVSLKPNPGAVQRRDIVATNLSERGAWRRIYDDYRVRQVVFEVKNYADLSPDDFRQLSTYLSGDYGTMGFFITRAKSTDLLAGRELGWVREIFHSQNRIEIVLTGSWFVRLLSKLRSPQKHQAGELLLNSILDTYTRLYLGPEASTSRRNGRILRGARSS
jgi:hypothetical protein